MKYLWFSIGAALTVVADQVTKLWAVKALTLDGKVPADAAMIRSVSADPIVVFQSWWSFKLAGNKGAAWGLFRGLPEQYRVLFFVAISLVAIAVIVTLYRKAENNILRVALTIILGGAIGNLIDRVRLGYVIDFIDWHTNNTWHWPTFNIADVAISTGVGLLLLDMLIHGKKKDAEDPASSEA